MELLTAAEIRAIERHAIEGGAAAGLDLMERAGQRVIDAAFTHWPKLATGPARAVVFCGPGNNGGDGFVIARLLHDLGWTVAVFLFGEAGKLPPDAAENCRRWRDLGQISPWDPDAISGQRADLFVDAVFGAGLTRAVPGLVLEPLQRLRQTGHSFGKVVAVDAPSGLCLDSGRTLRPGIGAVPADLTVTFHRPRPGHYLADGAEHCGALSVGDIGLDDVDDAMDRPAPRIWRNDRPSWARSKLDKADHSGVARHKYDHGHAVSVSGPMGRSGAARLAARGALRVGAGLVTVAAPGSAMMECAAQLTAIMLRRCDDAAGLEALLSDRRLNALCLGPGLGVGQGTRDLVFRALAANAEGAGPGVVLDADALSVFADDPRALFARLHPNVILTPHLGEFTRVFPDISDKYSAPPEAGPAYSLVDATREAAARAGAVVLLKGAVTVIADPQGRATLTPCVYDQSAPWLATAGAGDVLAGMLTGLLARGFGAADAAELGAWLHAEAARAFGPGLIAEDLPEMLPQVLRDLAG